MFEPYPHRIKKAQVVSLAVVFVVLLSGLIWLKSQPPRTILSPTSFPYLHFLKYIILLALLLFSLKAATLQYLKDYIFLFGAAVSFCVVQLAPFWLGVLSTNGATFSIPTEHLGLLSTFFLFVFMLFSAFTTGETAVVGCRKKLFIGVVLFSLFAPLLVTAGYAIQVSPWLATPHYEWIAYISIIALNYVIILIALVRYIFVYINTRFVAHFWFVLAILLFMFSQVYAIFCLGSGDSFSQMSFLLQLAGLAVLLWLPFVEHTRYMETESRLRLSLEKSLLKSEETASFMQKYVESADVGMLMFDEKDRIIFANKAFKKLTGFSNSQLDSVGKEKLFDKKNLEKFEFEKEKWKAARSSQFRIEFKNRHGENKMVLANVEPEFNRLHKYAGSRFVVMEIAAVQEFESKARQQIQDLRETIKSQNEQFRQQTEELADLKNYFDALIAGTWEIMLVLDKKGNCTFINDYGEKLLGFAARELTSRKLPDFLTDLEQMRRQYGDAMKVELRDYEAPVKSRDGKNVLCKWNVKYLMDRRGDDVGILCIGQDISEFKAMQNKLDQQTHHQEQYVSQRTAALQKQVGQLWNLVSLQSEEKVEPKRMLFKICQTLKDCGWRIVILAQKKENSIGAKIAAYSGLNERSTQKFVNERADLYKNFLQYCTEENKISQSFLLGRSTLNAKVGKLPQEESGESLDWTAETVLLIPLKRNSGLLGFITLFEPVTGKLPNATEVKILELFAEKAARLLDAQLVAMTDERRSRELMQTNKLMWDFITTLSHEIRTPINSILTIAAMLEKQYKSTPPSGNLKQLRVIKNNGENLLRMINNLLDLSKIRAGLMQVDYGYFPLGQLLSDAVERIQPLCDQKRLKLELRFDQDLPQYIFSDQEKIDRVLTNILTNAVKYTPKGKIIFTAKYGRKNQELFFSIKDTGIGISDQEIPKIFEEFKQSDKLRTSNRYSTGVGLAIAKQLWGLLGGTIQVFSKQGRGSDFQLLLPITKSNDEKLRDTGLQTAQQEKENSVVSGDVLTDNKQVKILLVDDNEDNLYALDFILKELGFNAIHARDGDAAVKLVKEKKPAIIFMDMMMPGIDGYEAAKRIRKLRFARQTPIIAMTAKSVHDDKKMAIKAGCNDYLTKPFLLDDVSQKLSKWLGNRQ
jgi:PAS domain S-box-containing protein